MTTIPGAVPVTVGFCLRHGFEEMTIAAEVPIFYRSRDP
jgi:hypothetical protein